MIERTKLPPDWRLTNLRAVGSFTNGINKGAEDFGFGVRFVNLLDVFGKCSIDDFPSGLVNATPSEIERYSLREGDVIFIRSSVKPSGVGLTVVIEKSLPQTVYSGFLIRFRPEPEQFEKPFLRYCFYNEEFRRDVISKSTVSANANINQVSLGQLEVALPPPHQQRCIATILSTMDEVIEATEKLVEKHQQIKAGLMHDLFTRGLWTRPELARGDHHGLPCEATAQEGQLRPPPEEAPSLYQNSPLGLIPKAWGVKSFSDAMTSAFLGSALRGTRDAADTVPLIKMGNLIWGELNLSSVERLASSLVTDERHWLRPGDFLFNTRNTPELVGKTAVYRGEFECCTYDNNLLCVRFKNGLDSRFVCQYMSHGIGKQRVLAMASGTTSVAAIYWSALSRFVLPVPLDTGESEVIANRVDAVRDLVNQETTHLAKLRQQKQGLMHDLLTGRVRVDGAE